ncbi:hypothetical protein AB0F20_09990 [Streptomyces goshikiensis]|uniref:hypothetical protein n=1 Tax=Streptomyces goshikiensis TaxID=1942 RepID=UPI0033D423A1
MVVSARTVYLRVGSSGNDTVRFDPQHVALLWELYRRAAPVERQPQYEQIMVESAEGAVLTVRVSTFPDVRFRLEPMGDSRQLCTRCEEDAIGGSTNLAVCPAHLDATLGPSAAYFNGDGPYERDQRLRRRLDVWERDLKVRRSATWSRRAQALTEEWFGVGLRAGAGEYLRRPGCSVSPSRGAAGWRALVESRELLREAADMTESGQAVR